VSVPALRHHVAAAVGSLASLFGSYRKRSARRRASSSCLRSPADGRRTGAPSPLPRPVRGDVV
jgi:hypothetical protein